MTTSTCSAATEATAATEAQPGVVRVMVVDDHVRYRSLVGSVVTAADGFALAGEAASQAEVLEALAGLSAPPDLVLLDVNLGEDSGIDVARRILLVAASASIVLISTMAKDELPPGATECGARGYLPKSRVSPSALREAWAGAYDW